MMKNSFTFGGVDMRETWGITVSETRDVMSPKLRERMVTVPGRDGSYDYGARTYDQRILMLECDITRPMTRAQLREVAYALSKKDRIVLWNEPDKYYIGRIYNAEELERVGTTQKRFTLEFTCDPFAYGRTVIRPIAAGENAVDYAGTARAPCLIVLNNTGSAAVVNVRVSALYKR